MPKVALFIMYTYSPAACVAHVAAAAPIDLASAAVPVIAGVVSFPWEVFVKDVGALGAVASMVIDKAEEEDEVLPAASVAVAVSE